jgi:hypothetical protein
MAILVCLSFIAINRRNLLLGLYVVTIIVFFIFETMLNRLAGVSFFALFSFLLIHAGTDKHIEETEHAEIKRK